MTSSAPPGLARLNRLDPAAAAGLLRGVCAAADWSAAVAAGLPYRDTGALLAAGDAATAALSESGLDAAMAGHPQIGRPAPGESASAREQAGMAGAPEALRARMLELNLRYQERFGHVFLVCATGLSAAQLLAAIEERLGNTPEVERAIVRTELGRINRIRLGRLAESADPADPAEPAEPAEGDASG
ncbi:2-oxo-4-hydroxy-4-carboxy-5-ureidoimidazoline decarboxylase [Streptomyces polyrhachis]|uniref:2-oxo-4-hydroxy-4-carboxy-5-ureidoimidazoline decarboxylase n=1 Tax=Streptomyces polyrhachis TaxID=1282885 RepID=A0ABW2GJC6_9ACTN